MTKPTIHPNGTHPDRLIADLCIARDAVIAASDAVKFAAPNPRDYYPQGEQAIESAMEEHAARLTALNRIATELYELAIHVSNQQRS